MSVIDLIRVAVLLSIALIVIGFALLSTWRDATSLFRQPSLLLRSLLAMNVILPLFAVLVVKFFTLRPAIEIVLICLAVSPVPPFLPQKQLKVAGHHEYIYGLLGATSLLSVVLVPVTIALIGAAFSRATHVSPGAVVRVVALTVLIPFAIGLLVHHLKPDLAVRLSGPLNKAGMALLVLALVPVLIKMWPGIVALVGDGTLIAIIAFIAVGLAAGHVLGGPQSSTRSVLALATATRHPGVALVIATANFPDDKQLILPALLLYLVVCTIISAPYVMWRRRQHAA
jgi:bile acid:Na+ symporter, BASS family